MTLFANYPSLKNRTVLITGGASGIGAAMVSQFCAQGSHVAFLDKDTNSAQQLITELRSSAQFIPHFIACDLQDITALNHAIAQAIMQLGDIAVLINNAANDTRCKTLDITESKWRDSMAQNLDHQFFAAQAVLPGMIKNRSGSIINLSSNCFLLGQVEDYPSYMTAKAAVIGLTRALAREFGHYNIRVNSISPGWVMTQRQIEKWLTPQAEEELLKTQSLKEKIYPDDIARAALFLAADDSRMCTKMNLVIDAGRA